jgi:hypothetical protein
MAREPTKPTGNMQRILDLMPDDGAPIDQSEIYSRLGYASGVGATLYAMEKCGLVKKDREVSTQGNPAGRGGGGRCF